jgi:hypothetical protein
VKTRIERLSLAALHMAASAGFDNGPLVASWLYRFGTLPRGPASDRDFGPDDDPMAVLGMTVGGAPRRLLEKTYEASSLPGWFSFVRSGLPVQLTSACKLYVSPTPRALVDAFPRVVEELVQCEVRSFKVGRGIEGLFRPDKIVAYFDTRADLHAAARALHHKLVNCPVHGVPFTADAGGDGLLSWGVDPPVTTTVTSWRTWLTGRLAESLAARATAPAEAAVAHALADIRSARVDARWTPAVDIFHDSPS